MVDLENEDGPNRCYQHRLEALAITPCAWSDERVLDLTLLLFARSTETPVVFSPFDLAVAPGCS